MSNLFLTRSNVPPRISLAFAMIEKHEKAERKAFMDEHGISELESACRIVQQMQD